MIISPSISFQVLHKKFWLFVGLLRPLKRKYWKALYLIACGLRQTPECEAGRITKAGTIVSGFTSHVRRVNEWNTPFFSKLWILSHFNHSWEIGNHPVDTQITADNIREYQLILPANGAPPPAVPVQANAVIQSQEVAQAQEITLEVCLFLSYATCFPCTLLF